MREYLIHTDNGLDGSELIGTADTIQDARAIAKREMERDPQRFVTLVDRYGGEHTIEA